MRTARRTSTKRKIGGGRNRSNFLVSCFVVAAVNKKSQPKQARHKSRAKRSNSKSKMTESIDGVRDGARRWGLHWTMMKYNNSPPIFRNKRKR